MVGWLIVSLTFHPLYFVRAQNRSPAEMSALMSLMGLSSVIAAILVLLITLMSTLLAGLFALALRERKG